MLFSSLYFSSTLLCSANRSGSLFGEVSREDVVLEREIDAFRLQRRGARFLVCWARFTSALSGMYSGNCCHPDQIRALLSVPPPPPPPPS